MSQGPRPEDYPTIFDQDEPREVRVNTFFEQAFEAAKLMAEEIARHPGSCIIWIFGDVCDCGQPPQCETPKGE